MYLSPLQSLLSSYLLPSLSALPLRSSKVESARELRASEAHPSSPSSIPSHSHVTLILVTGEMPTAGASEKSKSQQTQTSSAQGAAIEEILKLSGIPIRDEEVQRSPDFQPIKDLTERLLAPGRDSSEIPGRDHHHWQTKLNKFKQRNEDTFVGQPLHQWGTQRSLEELPTRVAGGWS